MTPGPTKTADRVQAALDAGAIVDARLVLAALVVRQDPGAAEFAAAILESSGYADEVRN